jgi:MPBQ/MSBQ methyltransferase
MDALAMDFPDNSFDLVWACESGEHMPDKKKFVEEMTRVLKPGGTLVIACWCQREETPATPFTDGEKEQLRFLYEEWAHPYFISIEEFCRLMKARRRGAARSLGGGGCGRTRWGARAAAATATQHPRSTLASISHTSINTPSSSPPATPPQGTGQLADVSSDDWTRQTIDSWRHSIWAGVWDPMPVFTRPHIWYKTSRDIITLERMRIAFDQGLMQYGMMRAVKKA